MSHQYSVAAYAILLATSTAGAINAPFWAACAGGCGLALVSLFTLRARAASVPQLREVSEPILVVSGLLNAAVFSTAAFAFGHLARWFWAL